MKNFIFLLVFITNLVSAQNVDALFSDANTLYKTGKYKNAIETYQKIEESEQTSSELYFNLGNCYYKLNQVAQSIYNYEKALLIDPSNEDAKNNLIIAKQLTLDRIEELPKSLFQKLNINYLQKFHYNTWALIVVILSIIAGILFLFFYFSNNPAKKRFYFITSMVSFILLLTSLIITFKQHDTYIKTKEAIIFAKEVSIKNAPTQDSEEIFTLHEGTKVKVLDTVDNWKKIKLIDGKIGWLLSKDVKILSIF
ncbi:tetratricopeptide repeat protein [Tenacibaculum sp. nBUS_03]|uniref:tetratricopeptide repeat protein n=1 Tax=Tenacibaculum sp. nBUS_03 TaxID=3395320 RepID=UPI003EB8795D